MLIAKGAPITEVQHLMGRSDPSVTLRVYSHWFKNGDTGSIDSVANDILGSLNEAAPPTNRRPSIANKPTQPQDGYQMDTGTAEPIATAS